MAVFYCMLVTCGGRSWTVERRYSEFDTLQARLKGTPAGVCGVQFPPKGRVFSPPTNKSRRMIESRRAGLEKYAQQLVRVLSRGGAAALGSICSLPSSSSSSSSSAASTGTPQPVQRADLSGGRGGGSPGKDRKNSSVHGTHNAAVSAAAAATTGVYAPVLRYGAGGGAGVGGRAHGPAADTDAHTPGWMTLVYHFFDVPGHVGTAPLPHGPRADAAAAAARPAPPEPPPLSCFECTAATRHSNLHQLGTCGTWRPDDAAAAWDAALRAARPPSPPLDGSESSNGTGCARAVVAGGGDESAGDDDDLYEAARGMRPTPLAPAAAVGPARPRAATPPPRSALLSPRDVPARRGAGRSFSPPPPQQLRRHPRSSNDFSVSAPATRDARRRSASGPTPGGLLQGFAERRARASRRRVAKGVAKVPRPCDGGAKGSAGAAMPSTSSSDLTSSSFSSSSSSSHIRAAHRCPGTAAPAPATTTTSPPTPAISLKDNSLATAGLAGRARHGGGESAPAPAKGTSRDGGAPVRHGPGCGCFGPVTTSYSRWKLVPPPADPHARGGPLLLIAVPWGCVDVGDDARSAGGVPTSCTIVSHVNASKAAVQDLRRDFNALWKWVSLRAHGDGVPTPLDVELFLATYRHMAGQTAGGGSGGGAPRRRAATHAPGGDDGSLPPRRLPARLDVEHFGGHITLTRSLPDPPLAGLAAAVGLPTSLGPLTPAESSLDDAGETAPTFTAVS